MIAPFDFLVLALGAWRLAYLLTNEAGPGNVLKDIRAVFGGDSMEVEPGSWEQLWSCVYCMTFWTAGALALYWAVDVPLVKPIVTFLALWGAATAIDMAIRRE